MSSKKLLLNVNCVNADFDDSPDHFVVELSKSNIQKIKTLAQNVKALDVFSLKYFDYEGSYCSMSTVDDIVTEKDIELTDLTNALIDAANDDASRMEYNMITVYQEGFRFTAVPKNCGDSELCRTDMVLLKELDNIEPLNAMSF